MKLHHQLFWYFSGFIMLVVVAVSLPKGSVDSFAVFYLIVGMVYFPISVIVKSYRWAKSKLSKKSDSGSATLSANKINMENSDSKDKQQAVSGDKLTVFKSSSNGTKPSAGYKIPAAPVGVSSKQKNSIDQLDCGYWVAAGQDVAVNKDRISGGMLYVGSKYNLSEPSLIDPHLSVSGSGDYSRDMEGYWPSYSQCSPEQRRAYLNWLKGGRNDPNTGIGYVFMYFYGLERRSLIGVSILEEQKDELILIIEELKRLLSIYFFNRSFKSYCSNLISFLEIKINANKVYLGEPSSLAASYQIPIDVRVAAGQAAVDRVPLPARWAFAWVATDNTISKPMPLKRCADKFAVLFARKYQEQYGDGLVIPINKRYLNYDYSPASSAIRMNNISIKTDNKLSIPDVTEIQGNKNKLEKIVTACTEKLEAYSRYIGKNPDSEGSIEASLLLPIELWPDSILQKITKIKEMASKGVYKSNWNEIVGALYAEDAGEITKDIAKKICAALSLFGIGVEYAGGKSGFIPEGNDLVVLYPVCSADNANDENEGYILAALTLQAASAVCVADDDFSDVEVLFLEKQIISWSHLSETHRNKLLAQLQILKSAPMQLKNIKSKLSGLPNSARVSVAGFLSAVVQVDNIVRPEEVKLLEKIYQSLGIDKNKVFDDLHVASAGGDLSLTKSAVEKKGFTLDPEKIAELKKDTDKISAILSEIFTDDVVPQVMAEKSQSSISASDEVSGAISVVGLTGLLNTFVTIVVSKPAWQRIALEAEASNLQLMLDGALEQINDACFEQFDMALIEGEDPLEVNSEVLEMMA